MKKIIMTINQFDQTLFFDLLFIKQGLTKLVVEKQEHYYYLDLDYNYFKNDLSKVINDLKKIFEVNNYHKAPLIINLNLVNMFIEEIELPKLSFQEERKAIQIELNKYYNDYQTRYLNLTKSYILNRQFKKIRVLLFDKEQYFFLLQFIKQLKHRVMSIRVASDVLAQAVIKYRLVDLHQPFVFINVTLENTMILVYHKRLISHHLYHQGFKINSEEDKEAFINRQSVFMNELATEVKKVIYRQNNIAIDNIYLHIETLNDDKMRTLLIDNLNREVKNVLNNPSVLRLLSIGALLIPSPLCFKLPFKVKRQK